MKKVLIGCLLIFSSTIGFAETKSGAPIKWKTFESNFAFSLKYPDCWKVQDADVTETTPAAQASGVYVQEVAKDCQGDKIQSGVQRGVAVETWGHPRQTREEATKEIALIEKNAPGDLQRKQFLIFKHIKQGDAEALIWVEPLKLDPIKSIRWQRKIYCDGGWWLDVTGPDINEPYQEYLDKFKAGDLALPEPEKTIIESIKCLTPKEKVGVKKSGANSDG